MSLTKEAVHIRELNELEHRIRDAESVHTHLEQQLPTANRAILYAGITQAFRRLQQILRSPAKSFNLWPLGLLIVGPCVTGTATLIVSQIAFDSFAVGLTSFVAVAGATAALLAYMLSIPKDSQLDLLAQDAQYKLRDAQILADNIRVELSNVERAIQTDKESRAAIIKSVQYKRELLLQQNWRAMRGPEWEAFLADVFHLLGGTIERTGKSGDQGVDLIVSLGQHRFAIQAKGYESSVSNSAVQEAVAGMAHYRCNRSAVIINSRFTPGAIALAKSNRCLLIGEDHIPAFVLGQLSL